LTEKSKLNSPVDIRRINGGRKGNFRSFTPASLRDNGASLTFLLKRRKFPG